VIGAEAADIRQSLGRQVNGCKWPAIRGSPAVDGRKRFKISWFQRSQCGRMLVPSRAKHLAGRRKKSSVGPSRRDRSARSRARPAWGPDRN